MDDKVYNRCKLCGDQYKACGSSTSNMINHCETKHKVEYQQALGTQETSETGKITKYVNVSKKAEWKRGGSKAVQWDRMIVRFVVDTSQSLAVIEKPSFRALLPPEYVAPSRRYFTDVCLVTCYRETNERLHNDIKQHKSQYIGIQVDHTTASNYDPYCNLCIQLVNDDFTLCSISVGTFSYQGLNSL